MPKAKPAIAPVPPSPVRDDEAAFIKETIRQFYGEGAVVRNFGPDPSRLQLHVETDREVGLELYDCAGILAATIVREQVSLIATRRGKRIFGAAKFAYRQGVIL